MTEPGAAGFQQDLQALIAAIKTSGAQPVICTQVMAATQGCSGLDSFLGNTENQILANRKIGQWITQSLRDYAASNNISLIDAAQLVPCDQSNLGDAIHLTESGHLQVAEVWADCLVPLLNESTSMPDESPK